MCEYGAKQSSCHLATAIMWWKVMHAIRSRQIIEHIYKTTLLIAYGKQTKKTVKSVFNGSLGE
jgi:hypothetical protein